MKKTLEALNQEYIPQGQNFATHLIYEANKINVKDKNEAYQYIVSESDRVVAKDRPKLLLVLHKRALNSCDWSVRIMADTIFEELLKRWFY